MMDNSGLVMPLEGFVSNKVQVRYQHGNTGNRYGT